MRLRDVRCWPPIGWFWLAVRRDPKGLLPATVLPEIWRQMRGIRKGVLRISNLPPRDTHSRRKLR